MHRLSRCLAAASLLVLLAACSKDKDIDTPAALVDLKAPTLKVQRVWGTRLGDKASARLRLGLDLAQDGNRVFAASHKGFVEAFDLATGKTLWRRKVRSALSAGPSASGELVTVGSSAGEVIALSAADGKERWRTRLNGEILAAPTISERVVAVRTVDGKMHGLSPQDGHEQWAQEQQVPRLSLRGTSRPAIAGDLAVCGFDNGKIMAVNMNDGSIQWEATLQPPHGKTELERLVDVDSTVHIEGEDVYAVGFQGHVAMLSRDNGQIWWSHDASSYRAMGIDDDDLYVANADGEVVAMRRRTGAELWRQKALLHRRLSSVATTPTSLITGDYQGYVHWLDKSNGELQARVRLGKSRITGQPLVAGNLVLVSDDLGEIAAYKTTPQAPPPVKPGKKSAAPKAAPAAPAAPGPREPPTTDEPPAAAPAAPAAAPEAPKEAPQPQAAAPQAAPAPEAPPQAAPQAGTPPQAEPHPQP